MSQEEETPRLHIDSDWKAEAQAEKERLAAKEKAQADAGGGPGGPRELPEASFKTLMGVLASQAIMGLGTMQDPDGKGVVVDLDGSRFSIDLLAVLEEKTKGNLSDDESRELTQILSELQARFVQISQLIAQQAATGGVQTPGGAAAPGGPAAAPPPSPLGP